MKKEDILTGVFSANNVEHWDDLENNSINLCCVNCQEESEENCDFCESPSNNDRLFGQWLQDENEKYYPDENGEFAGIYSPDFNTIQVVFSKYIIKGNMCSPCFPNQVDGDTDGEYTGYCIPADLMREEWQEENKNRITEI